MLHRSLNLQPWMMHRYAPAGYWIVETIFWILILIGLAILLRYLLKGHGQGQVQNQETAIDILKKRYARGEIDREEFQNRMKDL